MEEMFKQIDEVRAAYKNLDDWQQRQLLIDLLESGDIQFEKLATMYVEKLQGERTKNQHSIATLGLMLAGYCMTDKSIGGKNARKHLYESGAWTEKDGSIFGKNLAEEFK